MKILMAGFVLLAACGGDCIQPPCAFPVAVNLTVKSATSAPINKVTVTVEGTGGSVSECVQVCAVSALPGKHHMTIAAPGFKTFETDITVTGTVPDCGCPRINTQSMTVSLNPE